MLKNKKRDIMQEIEKRKKEALSKKLNYTLFKKKLSNSEVARKLGYADGAIVGRWRNEKDFNSNIMRMAQEALERHFNIPLEIWDSSVAYNTETIDVLLDRGVIENGGNCSDVFKKNKKIMENLKGKWYAYLYPSNPNSAVRDDGIWIVETTISEDYRVIDEWKNEGVLQIGENQSLIIKQSYDEHDITVIRFQNRQVGYGLFRFVIVSTQNGTENEMVNFGFYSRRRFTPKYAKKILGDIKKLQLKLDLDFNDRLVKEVTIK